MWWIGLTVRSKRRYNFKYFSPLHLVTDKRNCCNWYVQMIERYPGQRSAWTPPQCTLSRTGLSVAQRCPGQRASWHSAVRDSADSIFSDTAKIKFLRKVKTSQIRIFVATLRTFRGMYELDESNYSALCNSAYYLFALFSGDIVNKYFILTVLLLQGPLEQRESIQR